LGPGLGWCRFYMVESAPHLEGESCRLGDASAGRRDGYGEGAGGGVAGNGQVEIGGAGTRRCNRCRGEAVGYVRRYSGRGEGNSRTEAAADSDGDHRVAALTSGQITRRGRDGDGESTLSNSAYGKADRRRVGDTPARAGDCDGIGAGGCAGGYGEGDG